MVSFSDQKAIRGKIRKARDNFFYYQQRYLAYGDKRDSKLMLKALDRVNMLEKELNKLIG